MPLSSSGEIGFAGTAPILCLNVFSSREPVSASLENALAPEARLMFARGEDLLGLIVRVIGFAVALLFQGAVDIVPFQHVSLLSIVGGRFGQC